MTAASSYCFLYLALRAVANEPQCAPRRMAHHFNNALCGTVRARARAALPRGFLGGFERLALIPPESFSWYRSFATQKNDTPRRGSGKYKKIKHIDLRCQAQKKSK